jgi:hypothetical protein
MKCLRCLLTPLLLALAWPAALLAQASAEAQSPDEVPFIRQTLDNSTTFYGTGMKTLVAEVIQQAKLDEAKAAELTKAAEAAVEEKMVKSRTGLWNTWKELAVGGKVNQNAFWTTYRKLPEAIFTPEKSEHWTAALNRLLTADQLKLIGGDMEKRKARVEKAIADSLARGRDEWKTRRMDLRKAQAEALAKELALPVDAASQLAAGIQGSLAKGAAVWGQKVERDLREYLKGALMGGAEDRIAAVEAGNLNVAVGSDATADSTEETAWQEHVKTSLPAEAAQRVQQQAQARKLRRAKAVAGMTVAELDRKLRLSQTQRQQIEPLFIELVTQQETKMDLLMGQSYLNTDMLLMLLNGVEPKSFNALLSPEQQKVWPDMAQQYADWWAQY